LPYYINPIHSGLDFVGSEGDGYSIFLRWNQAFPFNKLYAIAYHIYFSTIEDNVFSEGIKYISVDGSLQVDIFDLVPGQLYHFAVRAVEYDPNLFDIDQLMTTFNGLKVYPESVLRQNISATDTIIPLLSTETFPSFGDIQIGVELINYLSNDTVNNNLIVAGGTSPQTAHFVIQTGGLLYLVGSSNVGQGTINNLTIVNSNAPSETWTIKCVSVQRDPMNNPIPTTANFAAIGSVSGSPLDQHGNPTIWIADGVNLSNGIISFSISETSPPFREGDYFTAQVIGATAGINGRGFNGTSARPHNTDGYDGYFTWSTMITYLLGSEETNSVIFPCQSRFEFPNYAFTIPDGYRQVTKDILTTDLSASDAFNVGFSPYDFAGYHRTDPVLLLNGTCVGSYIGGELYCADGYDGVGRQLRGLSVQEQNNQRQEVLLSLDGEPCCLVRRQTTGIVCDCYLASSEYPDDRCPRCYGQKFVLGYEQYFNPRRSDGRIMVRFGPANDDLKPYEPGWESELIADCWTLTVPTVKDRDFLVRFDQDDNEEYRYEILSVDRNRTLFRLEGVQKFRAQRVRKFDPIYQVRVFRNTQYLPQTLNTSISGTTGIPLHSHTIVVNENITSLSQINQTTGISFGHNHSIVNGVIDPIVLGHTHTIILPPFVSPLVFE
jgi:hypothetical protein